MQRNHEAENREKNSRSALYSAYGAQELKRVYQRNMLRATCIVAICATVVAVLLLHLPRERMVRLVPEDSRPIADLKFVEPHVLKEVSARRSEQVTQELARQIDAPVTTVPDIPLTFPEIEKPPEPDLAALRETEFVAAVESEDVFDLPSAQSQSDLASETGPSLASVRSDGESEKGRFLACNVLTKVKPEYPVIALERGVEGIAGIAICVDERGEVTVFPEEVLSLFAQNKIRVNKGSYKVDGRKHEFNYVTRYEEPSGYFFPQKVAEVVPAWKFEPAQYDGKPVKSFVIINHAFCLSMECDAEFQFVKDFEHY